MSVHLFAYGTLTFPEVWKRINLGEFESVPASLHGYSIYRVRDAVFPGIVAEGNSAVVHGRVYMNLDEETFFELDAYESELYNRQEVSVLLNTGEQVTCQAFVIPENRRHALTDEPWDPAHFEENELSKYLSG